MSDVDFKVFKDAVRKKFEAMTKHPKKVFRVAVSKDEIWDTYMKAFPPGTNEVFRERREYDCVCCKQFLRAVGNIVMLTDDRKVVSIWDIDVPTPFKEVAAALDTQMKEARIRDIFLHSEGAAGTDVSRTMIDDEVISFHHFHVKIPKKLVNTNGIAAVLGEKRSAHDVLHRALVELRESALETVIELTEQNSLYKGQEFVGMVEKFLTLKREFLALGDAKAQDVYAWQKVQELPQSATHIRNSAIGTLLVDLSDDMELDQAVRKYEKVVAPTNYKRPTALVTKAMIKRAEKTVEELGFMEALPRRYAVTEDVTVNNVLFADRSARKFMKNAFEEMAEDVGTKKISEKSLDKVEAVTAETFVKDILPKAETVDILVDNSHESNLMTLLAPLHPEAKGMLKWYNNFSWSYNGDVTDSIKARVKRAGGDVTGDLRCSLGWGNSDDLDLHITTPNLRHIYYSDKLDRETGGCLDVDMNVDTNTREATVDHVAPVENITFPKRSRMVEGEYHVAVHQYTQRNTEDGGFTVEMEFMGELRTFVYDKCVRQSAKVTVVRFKFTHKDGIKMIESLPEATASREVWGIKTMNFVKCRMVMNSPNHWDENSVGNKHLFFILEGCKKEGKARGFYNEFLTDELLEHRKVFEMLGARMKAEESDEQLSGVGFSTTQRNEVLVRVGGTFNRIIKVTF